MDRLKSDLVDGAGIEKLVEGRADGWRNGPRSRA
jgi:hypothetical protein